VSDVLARLPKGVRFFIDDPFLKGVFYFFSSLYLDFRVTTFDSPFIMFPPASGTAMMI
jgi:hypothetical protein